MKNGKLIIAVTIFFVAGIALGSFKTKPKAIKKPATKDQYKNRLSEFYLSDIEQGQKEFDEFVDLGLSNSDAFDLTIVKKFYF
jgi:hypothetical protein